MPRKKGVPPARDDSDDDRDDDEFENGAEENGEIENVELEQALLVVADQLIEAFRLAVNEWLRESSDDLLSVVKDGVREGMAEFLEDFAAKNPHLFALWKSDWQPPSSAKKSGK